MAKTQKAGLSTGQKRKAKYASFSESDKTSRNKQIEDALGRGADNIVAVGETETVERIEVDPRTHKLIKRSERVVIARTLIDVAMPSSDSSRAGKRARLKLGRARKVTPVKHYQGPCGNVGCKTCNPSQH
jgi:hypothetical protein